MATVASGQIDMNAVHIELGGGSGNSIGFNDADLRLMCGSNQNTQFGMANMYAKAADFAATCTVGTKVVTFSPTYVSFTEYFRGYATDKSMGSMSSTSEPDYMGGGTISQVQSSSGVVANFRTFNIRSNASSISNTDNTVFNSVVVNSTTFDRGDFTFSSSSGQTDVLITHTDGGYSNTTDTAAPFPSNGSSYTITFRRRV